jgi:hypothetical protein
MLQASDFVFHPDDRSIEICDDAVPQLMIDESMCLVTTVNQP